MSEAKFFDKIVAQGKALQDALSRLPRPLVFTNGVFDVLHRGHVSYLDSARNLGGSLVVAVNTDMSARQLGKGPDRPLNKEIDRAVVLAGLASVSLVTFFDEKTPVALIRQIRPDIFVKGGDYKMDELEETEVVRKWGGESLAIPFVDGFSTTSLVKKIRQGLPVRKAAFLDRDGVINLDRAYVHRWSEFEFLPGAVDAMRRLKDAGYALIIVTNQSGIARGKYTEVQYKTLTNQMRDALRLAGAEVDAVFHCPHHPDGEIEELSIECNCRKPAPGMILRAVMELGINVSDSLMVGDKISDIEAARAAAVGKVYAIRSEYIDSSSMHGLADAVFNSLADCVDSHLKF